MPSVKFTSALKRFFPALSDTEISGDTVQEALTNLEKRYPGLMGYLTEDTGQLRTHVNIYVGTELIKDRRTLTDKLEAADEILIFQALSGG